MSTASAAAGHQMNPTVRSRPRRCSRWMPSSSAVATAARWRTAAEPSTALISSASERMRRWASWIGVVARAIPSRIGVSRSDAPSPRSTKCPCSALRSIAAVRTVGRSMRSRRMMRSPTPTISPLANETSKATASTERDTAALVAIDAWAITVPRVRPSSASTIGERAFSRSTAAPSIGVEAKRTRSCRSRMAISSTTGA